MQGSHQGLDLSWQVEPTEPTEPAEPVEPLAAEAPSPALVVPEVLASIADGQVSQSLLRPFEELGPKPGFLVATVVRTSSSQRPQRQCLAVKTLHHSQT